MRVLALDYGSARCGCAVSDPTGTLVTPIETVARPAGPAGFRRLCELVKEFGAEQVIVGLPLDMRGGEGSQARESRKFAERLSKRIAVPVELFDERLTTRMAARFGGRADEDSRAAAHLLEGWLQIALNAGGGESDATENLS